MTKRVREEPNTEDGSMIVTKMGLDRHRIDALLAYFDNVEKVRGGLTDVEMDICELLEMRQWDGSSAPKKFAKMLDMMTCEDLLHHSYTFNGAAQTGRFSSRGIQMHNMTNKTVGFESGDKDAELDAIDLIDNLEI